MRFTVVVVIAISYFYTATYTHAQQQHPCMQYKIVDLKDCESIKRILLDNGFNIIDEIRLYERTYIAGGRYLVAYERKDNIGNIYRSRSITLR